MQPRAGTPTAQMAPAARERRPPVGTARRRRAAGKNPEFGGGSPLGRDPGVQHHSDGCVVHAFRCASRSGADRRSAFPCLRVTLHGGVEPRLAPSRELHFYDGRGVQDRPDHEGFSRWGPASTAKGGRDSELLLPVKGLAGRHQPRQCREPPPADPATATRPGRESPLLRHVDSSRLRYCDMSGPGEPATATC